jgi:DNA-binding XRE family transcriptional regulator
MLPSAHRHIYFPLAQWVPLKARGTQIKKHPRTLGERLRHRRAKLRLHQSKAAQQLGVSTVTLSKWERDLIKPKAEYAERLAKYLDFDVKLLLNTCTSTNPRS